MTSQKRSVLQTIMGTSRKSYFNLKHQRSSPIRYRTRSTGANARLFHGSGDIRQSTMYVDTCRTRPLMNLQSSSRVQHVYLRYNTWRAQTQPGFASIRDNPLPLAHLCTRFETPLVQQTVHVFLLRNGEHSLFNELNHPLQLSPKSSSRALLINCPHF